MSTEKLTDEEIELEIFKWLGYERRKFTILPDGTDIYETVWWPEIAGDPRTNDHFQEHCELGPKQYTKDFNAVQAATRDVPYETRRRIVIELHCNFGAGYITDSHWATPKMWAIALLRTVKPELFQR